MDNGALFRLGDVRLAALELVGERLALGADLFGRVNQREALEEAEGRHVVDGRGAGLDVVEQLGGRGGQGCRVTVELIGGLGEGVEAVPDIGEDRGGGCEVALGEGGKGALNGCGGWWGGDVGVGSCGEVEEGDGEGEVHFESGLGFVLWEKN